MKKMKNIKTIIYLQALLMICFSSCAQNNTKKPNQTNKNMNTQNNDTTLTTAVFGAGCFWCVEAIFQQVNGVEKIESGYCNGTVKNPTYKEVCTGNTGHAEVCKIWFNPQKVSYETLLSIFWQTHDPTTLNRQGNDIGTQYRSGVYYNSESQKASAQKYKEELDKSGAFSNPIVTEIVELNNYFSAEDYHQNYYNQNSEQSYCQFVIAPKLEKFKKVFGDKFQKK